jgi:methylglutaconyl-CoA hydratase
MTDRVVLSETDARGVASLTFNRPHVNNAYNLDVISSLIDAVGRFAEDDAVRMVVLRGEGRHFQAGADLNWIQTVSALTPDENLEVSRHVTEVNRRLNEFPKPTLALVQGGCFGGGTGIVASCDIVIASEDAIFAITEARWGMIANPIFPQLVAAMGEHNVRRYALSCERFDAVAAYAMGLVHGVCPTGKLDEVAEPIIETILQGGPNALRETKKLIKDVAALAIPDPLFEHLAARHAEKRQTPEAEEGLESFVEKRDPSWYPGAG